MMKTASILQIVSGFRPGIDGMGDYSRLLGKALWRQHSIRSHFLVYKRPPGALDPSEISPNTISYCETPSPSACLKAVAKLKRENSFDCILLHYGPYGYSGDGLPNQFTEVVQKMGGDMRLLIFFHELVASGRPWQRAFWTKGVQKRSAVRLMEVADVAFTSNTKHRQVLESFNRAHRELIRIPIFSNVGEPDNLRPLRDRERTLVVFGQLTTRLRLYNGSRNMLENLCRKLRIEKVIDVGSGTSPLIPESIGSGKTIRAGWMEDQPLSDLMANSIAGIIGYGPELWEKSGVMAAYLAHAMVPILVPDGKRTVPEPLFVPYVSGEKIDSLASPDGSVSDARLQAIADAAHDYYQRNQSLSHSTEVIARAVTQR